MRRLPILIAVFALLAVGAPALAFAAAGYTTANVHMRAGPATAYPIVTTIPARASVEIHGCLAERDWCDVTWDGYRGWVSARYLESLYEGGYVYLPDYFDVVHVPIVVFVLGTYWDRYYRGRPWFRRRSYWENYWRRHRRPSPRLPRRREVSPPRPSRPAIRPPERRAPSVRAPERGRPSVRTPKRRAPATRGGASQRFRVPSRGVPPRSRAVRPPGGATFQRSIPRSRGRGTGGHRSRR